LAGEPLVVDELSLVQTGPARVKMNCRDPAKLRGFVRIFLIWSAVISDLCQKNIKTK
jgi:hypothetical protein